MSDELQFHGSKSVTFEVLSPMNSVQAMKHIRVGTKPTIKAMENTRTLFKWKKDIVSARMLQMLADNKTIKIISTKLHSVTNDS